MTIHLKPNLLCAVSLALLLLFPGLSRAQSLDIYGGFSEIQRNPTGFFRLETINKRAFLITPSGHPFLALTVVHTSWGNAMKIPSDSILKNLRAWNYNCVGYQLIVDMRSKFPFIEGVWIKGAKRERPVGKNAIDLQYEFNDVFDTAILKINEAIIKTECNRNRDNKMYIGYYFMDRPVWDILLARQLFQIDYPTFIKRLPANAPGKLAYVEFLKRKYSKNITNLNKSYHTSFTSFEEVLSYPFRDFSMKGSQEFNDDLEFHGIIAEQYYSTTTSLIKKYDPNHLIFGDRFKLHPLTENFGDESVLRVAGKYVDVISVEPDFGKEFSKESFNRLHEITGRPIMIDDHEVEGFSPEMGLTKYFTARANAVAKYQADAFSTGYIVGYGKCQYFDRPGENLPRGLVDTTNAVRADFVNILKESNKTILLKAYKAAKTPKP